MGHRLTTSVIVEGVGLHLGLTTRVALHPASPGQGRFFVRVDLPDQPIIPANLRQVRESLLSTELGTPPATVRTVEHLLAALVALGIEDVRIDIDGPEVPLCDGSALPWLQALESSGLTPYATGETPWVLTMPLSVQEKDAFVAAFPSPDLRLSYGIDFTYAPIGQQWLTWQPQAENFAQALAGARTFGFADQIAHLRETGLIKGGSLENALVCDHETWLNPPLRFADEPVRHKLLDLLGDLALLGSLPQAHIVAYKASHRLHTRLAQQLEDWAQQQFDSSGGTG
ncbi:UDP-3-O-acyl-N-acetylglucosamine deacetylase [Synechocystis sp. LKSZ1]|uniref:UDP-3-O-acyl-N-acetylglucosamine deacetylase n=1 Tax=Synechocystis sp. LKSZ1 TaxID=3144951 RepID=UPI00336BB314